MPPDNSKFKDAKFYIDGKEIPCEIHEVKDLDYSNDIDNFGLHFNPEETNLSLHFQSKLSSVWYAKLLGIWDRLNWYQKLWLRIISLFRR